ncbi:hypothetical protein ABTK52_18650, partial [Acinetobacter baumannii]
NADPPVLPPPLAEIEVTPVAVTDPEIVNLPFLEELTFPLSVPSVPTETVNVPESSEDVNVPDQLPANISELLCLLRTTVVDPPPP